MMSPKHFICFAFLFIFSLSSFLLAVDADFEEPHHEASHIESPTEHSLSASLPDSQHHTEAPSSADIIARDPLFNPSSQFLLGPEIGSVESTSPVFDGLRHALIQDVATLTNLPASSLHSITDIDSLPYEEGARRAVGFRPLPGKGSSLPLNDDKVCGYEINHYCPQLQENHQWGDLALCLHDMYHRTQASIRTYNRYMELHHNDQFKPIETLAQLPLISAQCRAGLKSSLTVQCIRQIKALCGMPEATQHILMCVEEEGSKMNGQCGTLVDSFGGISDRGHSEFRGNVVRDMAGVEKAAGKTYKEVKEAGWGYYFEKHPLITYSILVLASLLVVLGIYLCFGDVATIKRKLFGKKSSSFGGRMVIPENDDEYKDNFGDTDYDL